jgi:hypothetical protein
MNWKERISKNMLDGKLYYEKAKRIDQGTVSNSNRNPDDHDCLCKVGFNPTFAPRHSKKKEFECAGGPELKPLKPQK